MSTSAIIALSVAGTLASIVAVLAVGFALAICSAAVYAWQGRPYGD